MRCPECKHNQRHKEGTRCSKCRYQFVFQKRHDQISDYALRQLIGRLSDHGQLSFTTTQLALEICRLWRKKILGPVGCGIIALVISAIAGLFVSGIWKWWGGMLIPVAVLLPLAIGLSRKEKSKLPFDKARTLVNRYHQAHPIQALANGTAFRDRSAMPEPFDPHYAPERILIVERDDLVDMLIRNRFHLSHKAVVVSSSGYPESVFSACQGFLRNHPDTPVQLIHDASLRGFALASQLAADPKWAFARQQMIDLGIPQSALQDNHVLPWLPSSYPTQADGTFSIHHAQQLRAGYRMPLDHIGPKSLTGLLGTAVVGGSWLLIPAALSATSGLEVEVDYG